MPADLLTISKDVKKLIEKIDGLPGKMIFASTQVAGGPPSACDVHRIVLFDSGGDPIRTEPATARGLAKIVAWAVTGDVIRLPPATISGTYSVPVGVKMIGLSRYASILSGQITLGAGSTLENLSVIRSVDSGSDYKGVVIGATGTAYISDCDIEVTNAGAGAAYGVSVDGNGDVECWGSYLYGNSGSGNGYAMYHAGGTGNGYIYGGRCYGTTGSFNV